MKIAELKRLPDTCGFVSFTQELNIQSTVGRRLFLNSDFLTDRPSIIRELSNTDSMLAFIDKEHHKKDIASILLLLSEVKDIEKTLTNLDSNKILNDIELFEIKNFSFTAKKLLEIVYRYTSNNELYIEGQKEVDFVVFDETIRILDPENSGIPTFYIYDAYSEDLAALRHREQNETDSEQLAEIQAQILDLLKNLQSEINAGIILITHDLGVVAEMADRVAVMYAGEIVEIANVNDLFNNPKHPYTRSLLNSIPQLDTETEKLHVIQGIVPSLTKLERTGCRFSQRIPWIKESEHEKNPTLHEVEKEHFVRCTCWKNFHFEK